MGDPAPLVVDLDGYEGPLDLLLALARAGKVDLRELPLAALAEQVLAFLETAAAARLDLSADGLVTAAWLAFLKSRLLLPGEAAEEGEAVPDQAPDQAFRRARLDALRRAAEELAARPRLGLDAFARGGGEGAAEGAEVRTTRLAAGLHDLLAAYARVRTRDDFRPLALDRPDVMTMEEALRLLRPALAGAPWAELAAYLPPAGPSPRSAMAATFAGVLELVREGRAEVRQDAAFGPLMVRGREGG